MLKAALEVATLGGTPDLPTEGVEVRGRMHLLSTRVIPNPFLLSSAADSLRWRVMACVARFCLAVGAIPVPPSPFKYPSPRFPPWQEAWLAMACLSFHRCQLGALAAVMQPGHESAGPTWHALCDLAHAVVPRGWRGAQACEDPLAAAQALLDALVRCDGGQRREGVSHTWRVVLCWLSAGGKTELVEQWLQRGAALKEAGFAVRPRAPGQWPCFSALPKQNQHHSALYWAARARNTHLLQTLIDGTAALCQDATSEEWEDAPVVLSLCLLARPSKWQGVAQCRDAVLAQIPHHARNAALTQALRHLLHTCPGGRLWAWCDLAAKQGCMPSRSDILGVLDTRLGGVGRAAHYTAYWPLLRHPATPLLTDTDVGLLHAPHTVTHAAKLPGSFHALLEVLASRERACWPIAAGLGHPGAVRWAHALAEGSVCDMPPLQPEGGTEGGMPRPGLDILSKGHLLGDLPSLAAKRATPASLLFAQRVGELEPIHVVVALSHALSTHSLPRIHALAVASVALALSRHWPAGRSLLHAALRDGNAALPACFRGAPSASPDRAQRILGTGNWILRRAAICCRQEQRGKR